MFWSFWSSILLSILFLNLYCANRTTLPLLSNATYVLLQAICSKYGMAVESSSQFDRRALNCLINYYLNIDMLPPKVLLNYHHFLCFVCSVITPLYLCATLISTCSTFLVDYCFQETLTGCRKELFTCHQLDTITDITSCPSSNMGKVLSDVLHAVVSGLLFFVCTISSFFLKPFSAICRIFQQVTS